MGDVSLSGDDLGKVVVSGFVRCLSDLCPGMYGESTGRILMKFCTLFTVILSEVFSLHRLLRHPGNQLTMA